MALWSTSWNRNCKDHFILKRYLEDKCPCYRNTCRELWRCFQGEHTKLIPKTSIEASSQNKKDNCSFIIPTTNYYWYRRTWQNKIHIAGLRICCCRHLNCTWTKQSSSCISEQQLSTTTKTQIVTKWNGIETMHSSLRNKPNTISF